jgi:uncharacterized protein YraI
MKHTKKLIALTLVLMSVLAIAVPAMAAYSTMYVDCSVGETVRLRSSASTSSTILANVPRGTTLDAEYYNSNWYHIRNYTHSNGVTYNGYMMSSFLSSTYPSSSTPWLERYGVPTLSTGSGATNYVKALQIDLMTLGYNLMPYYDDGYYGPTTEGAVFSFQMAHPPLVADGICGNATKEALSNALFGD